MEEYDKLKRLVLSMEKDIKKFNKNKYKLTGTRLSLTIREVLSTASSLRKTIWSMKKNK
jgi:hypothetical protein